MPWRSQGQLKKNTVRELLGVSRILSQAPACNPRAEVDDLRTGIRDDLIQLGKGFFDLLTLCFQILEELSEINLCGFTFGVKLCAPLRELFDESFASLNLHRQPQGAAKKHF